MSPVYNHVHSALRDHANMFAITVLVVHPTRPVWRPFFAQPGHHDGCRKRKEDGAALAPPVAGREDSQGIEGLVRLHHPGSLALQDCSGVAHTDGTISREAVRQSQDMFPKLLYDCLGLLEGQW